MSAATRRMITRVPPRIVRESWHTTAPAVPGERMATNEQLLELTAVELRRRIGTKEISPVELLEACIGRIERLNPAVNAVTAVCYERARDEAKAAEKAV